MDQKVFDKACRLWNMEAYTVERMPEVVSPEAFCAVVEAIASTSRAGGRILIMGKGDSAIAARKMVRNLCLSDIPAIFLDTNEGKHAILGLLRRGDTLILVSKGGGTEELVDLIEPAREKGTLVIGVTQNPASMLGMKSDLLLRVMVVRDVESKDTLGNASTIALFVILDGVCEGVRQMLKE